MSLNSFFRTDKSLELEGLRIEYEDPEGNLLAWFLCKRPGGLNYDYSVLLQKKIRSNAKAFKCISDADREDLLRRIMAEVYATTVILDWGGDIEGPDKKKLKCTKKNIYWLFAEDCPDLFDNLQTRLSMLSNWAGGEKIEEK